MLDRVTITGPDDSIDQTDLLALSEEFPFVEWGILASKSNEGSPRFPSVDWMMRLQSLAPPSIKLSLHLCGQWVRDLLIGQRTVPIQRTIGFQRIQLNFHAEKTKCMPTAFSVRLHSLMPRQFIFQLDGNGGNEHLQAAQQADPTDSIDAVGLFDVSGGAGILPREWPKAREGSYLGYAGGLGPDNLAEQIPLILKAAGNARIWIDMETKVRSDNDSLFDLAKVRRCLEIAKPFIGV